MTDVRNTRELVLEMLMEVMEKNQYSHLILRDVLNKYQYLEKSERAFMTRLTEGTIEKSIELDYIINLFSKVKVKKMKPLIRNLLRMSVYQIRYMDRVPDSAVCNEAVKIAKKRGFGQLSGFVNGVLRNIVRNPQQIHYPDKEKEPANYLEIRYSIPRWMIEQWITQYGVEKTETFVKEFGKSRAVSIRTNLLKTTPKDLQNQLESAGISVIRNEQLPYAMLIGGFDYLESIPAFLAGEFYVQDASSMMVAETAKPKEHSYIIDVCAAPGGKSTHLAEMMHGTGMVEARDLTAYKVGLIDENITRHQLSNMRAIEWDATQLDENAIEKADVLICDLPCSGLGVIGKKTDIRHKMTLQKQHELVELQRRMLDTVYRYVKQDGILIYSTCTIHEEENEGNVRWFLNKHPNFSLISEKQMLPGEFGQDGFFIAKMVRRNNIG